MKNKLLVNNLPLIEAAYAPVRLNVMTRLASANTSCEYFHKYIQSHTVSVANCFSSFINNKRLMHIALRFLNRPKSNEPVYSVDSLQICCQYSCDMYPAQINCQKALTNQLSLYENRQRSDSTTRFLAYGFLCQYT